MKVRASVKKISPDDKIVWRKGRGKNGILVTARPDHDKGNHDHKGKTCRDLHKKRTPVEDILFGQQPGRRTAGVSCVEAGCQPMGILCHATPSALLSPIRIIPQTLTVNCRGLESGTAREQTVSMTGENAL